ncbi:MAG: hypothetical protein L7U23_07970 [Crocinitomicaceae bacterium]|jgi:hypothetical protein|nr:hypothetical protein [Crocinitomicaceae bacterium]
MRLLKTIPHERYLIELHQYNKKYILKITLEDYAQTFKIAEMDDYGPDAIEAIIYSNAFLSNCLKRFISMRSDFTSALNSVKNEN